MGCYFDCVSFSVQMEVIQAELTWIVQKQVYLDEVGECGMVKKQERNLV